MEAYIQKALAGDWDAFSRLYDEYAPSALRLAAAATGRTDLAADAVQEAFLRVWRKGRQLRGEAFGPWFYRIVLHESRRAARRNPLPVEVRETAGGSFTEGSDLGFAVERAMACLSPEHRTVLAVRFLLGHTEQETASILGLPLGTVKSRIHSARGALERALQREEERI